MNHVNIWAVNLGFLVKLKRPPKVNQDGSKTLRVYCATYKKSSRIPDDISSAMAEGAESQACSANGSVAKSERKIHSQCSSSMKSERFESMSSCSHVRCCQFGLTFKADPATDCWLLYQEYSKEKMTHSHRLEQDTYANIREYVQLYTDKVRSLTELKELIYEKFGLEYTLNQISYFQGRWTAEAYIIEKQEANLQDDEFGQLIKLLKKNAADFLDYDYDASEGNLRFLFYASTKMREMYLRSSDIVFINKRLTMNRFNRPIMLWFTVTATGHSQLVALTMYEKEEIGFFQRVAKCFLRAMHNVVPQTIIIERQLKLCQALKDVMPTSQVLFCYFHILRTLKSQYAFLEKDRPDEFKILTDLPVIDRTSEFEK